MFKILFRGPIYTAVYNCLGLEVNLYPSCNISPDLFSSIFYASLGFLVTIPQLRTSVIVLLSSRFCVVRELEQLWSTPILVRALEAIFSLRYFWSICPTGMFCLPWLQLGCICDLYHTGHSARWEVAPFPRQTANAELCISMMLSVSALPSPFPKGGTTFQCSQHFRPNVTKG